MTWPVKVFHEKENYIYYPLNLVDTLGINSVIVTLSSAHCARRMHNSHLSITPPLTILYSGRGRTARGQSHLAVVSVTLAQIQAVGPVLTLLTPKVICLLVETAMGTRVLVRVVQKPVFCG